MKLTKKPNTLPGFLSFLFVQVVRLLLSDGDNLDLLQRINIKSMIFRLGESDGVCLFSWQTVNMRKLQVNM